MADLDQFRPKVLLAPMAGVTDPPFRAEAEHFGCYYSVSEMVACEQLARARPDMVRRAAGGGLAKPLVIQLAGREAEWMARGAALAADAGADIIDINMGCPRKSVTSGAAGAALMREPDQALRLIDAVVSHANLPVTLKMRLGWSACEQNAADLARRAEAAGVAMLVVHGRTRQQFFSGRADWRAIAEVVDAVRIPVIANGDIANAADAREAMAQSGAAGVMVGRAAQGKPWLVGEIERALRDGDEIQAPPRALMLESLLRLHEATLEFYGLDLGLRVARKHLAWAIDAYLPTHESAIAERKRICTMTQAGDVRAALKDLFLADHNDAAARKEAA